MSDLFRLDGRVALVTGASRGLGFAMAEALAAHGAQVIINARDPAAVDQAAGRIGGEAMPRRSGERRRRQSAKHGQRPARIVAFTTQRRSAAAGASDR